MTAVRVRVALFDEVLGRFGRVLGEEKRWNSLSIDLRALKVICIINHMQNSCRSTKDRIEFRMRRTDGKERQGWTTWGDFLLIDC